MSNIAEFMENLPAIEKPVSDILGKYDPKSTPQVNITSLVDNHNRNELEQCVTYIKSLKPTYPTIIQRLEARKGKNKPDLAGDISIFINGVIEIDCNACGTQYCYTHVDNTSENEVDCYICHRHSHKSCYNNGDIKPGIYFICSVCVKNKVIIPEVVPPETPENVHVESNTNGDDGIEEEEKSKEEAEEMSEASKRETICPRLVVGECPHGITGKGCPYKHPKWCFKYSRYGDRNPEGCRRGDRCWYYHPKLCDNSLNLNICLNKKCKEVHILGTRRYQPKNQTQWNHPSSSNMPNSYNLQSSKEFPSIIHKNNRQSPNPWNNSPQNESNDSWKNTPHNEVRNPWQNGTQNEDSEPWSNPKQKEVAQEQKMESFLEKCLAKMNSQVTSAISAQVNEAVERSLQPLKENIRISQIGRSQLVNKEIQPTPPPQDATMDSILKLLKQLVPQSV